MIKNNIIFKHFPHIDDLTQICFQKDLLTI